MNHNSQIALKKSRMALSHVRYGVYALKVAEKK